MKKIISTVLLIILVFSCTQLLNSCGEKGYTKDDILGIWYDEKSETAWTFSNNGEYGLLSSLMGVVEKGNFNIEKNKLKIETTESKVDKKQKSMVYNIKIGDNTLYMTTKNGEVSQYNKISAEGLRKEWNF